MARGEDGGEAVIGPTRPVESPEEVLEVAKAMRMSAPSEAEQELAHEGVSSHAYPRRRTARSGFWTKKAVVIVIILLLLLSLVTGFFVML